jgi:hypothetical protein
MIVSKLIEYLKTLPQDAEVMIQRGEWGPSRIYSAPRTALVRDANDKEGHHNWEIDFPELQDEEWERPRITVVLID